MINTEITKELIEDLKQVSNKIGYFKDASHCLTTSKWNQLFEGHTLANDFTLDLLATTEIGSNWIDTPEETILTYWEVKRVIVDWLAGRFDPATEDEKIQKHLNKVLTN